MSHRWDGSAAAAGCTSGGSISNRVRGPCRGCTLCSLTSGEVSSVGPADLLEGFRPSGRSGPGADSWESGCSSASCSADVAASLRSERCCSCMASPLHVECSTPCQSTLLKSGILFQQPAYLAQGTPRLPLPAAPPRESITSQ